jgi:methyltransferase (TIGR00027 family)
MQGASKTALMVCAYRARCSRWERPLFVDRWAEQLAGEDGMQYAAGFDKHWPAMEEWMALRVAYLDRLVAITTDRLGVRQVVILGAGYDTRAARLPYSGVRWFEVDHPDTQAAKRERLARVPGYPVDAATYASCDFEREDPVDRLFAAGLSPTEATLVIWEGVVPYLTEDAVRTTATRLAAALDKRSLVAFDSVGKKIAAGENLNERDRETRQFVGDLAEPVRFGSDHITPLLAECGYRWVRTVSFDDLALQWLGDYKRDRLFRFQRMVTCSASVPDVTCPLP